MFKGAPSLSTSASVANLFEWSNWPTISTIQNSFFIGPHKSKNISHFSPPIEGFWSRSRKATQKYTPPSILFRILCLRHFLLMSQSEKGKSKEGNGTIQGHEQTMKKRSEYVCPWEKGGK
jgi:hypothetical protein